MAAAIFALCLGTAFLAIGLHLRRSLRAAAGWPQVDATVVAAGIGVMSTEHGEAYHPEITYEYVVDGATHRSDRYAYILRGSPREKAQARLPDVGAHIQARYDPQDPAEACIVVDGPWLSRVLIVVGAIAMAAAVDVLVR